ncbi:hypothetical protein AB6A23_16930 [Paenibacillus tarimensis]
MLARKFLSAYLVSVGMILYFAQLEGLGHKSIQPGKESYEVSYFK